MQIECTKLCILSAVKQAYSCLWHYKLQHILIALVAALPFCLAGFLGGLDTVFSVTARDQPLPEGFNLSFTLLVLTTFIWAFPVIILWHRLYLLGPEHLIRRKIWPLITRSLNVISHSLIFFGFGLVTAVLMTAGIVYLRINTESAAMAGTISELGQMEAALYSIGALIVVCFLLIIGLRLSMAFAAQSIGKTLGFTVSWRMTRKNTFRMLIATILVISPLLALDGALIWAADHFWQIDLINGTAPNPDMMYLFVYLTAPLITLPLAALCSLTSSFYRHCGCAEFRSSLS
ncbi:hypothetical protein [Paremcibacter congregatus]|uniref:Glycerophosphoryl diester phosphodiesterase membrane domain-containing protein n=1 Tax=Paremcibacter congregatus TaxID=2043170 RepID=A0A2G4YPZ1_9PROT|nr:hypothetical protein [Paremcibacter congregatus]PHZ84393.1 hypothetical protein CRD36_11285 [Paremcibacter congregatus]QDE28611.1 hypothetical protein FIV45_15695 [Paremcibacter congregatus]|tara:strand:- start:1267 stop:2136 length:870 start_codon:yes stop_codon:yes gene_type:complete